jgi:hypothetical protein
MDWLVTARFRSFDLSVGGFVNGRSEGDFVDGSIGLWVSSRVWSLVSPFVVRQVGGSSCGSVYWSAGQLVRSFYDAP